MKKIRRRILFLPVLLLLVFSCKNPMVIYYLGEIDTEDYSVVALLVSTGEWFYSLNDAVAAAPAGTPASPELIELRRNVQKPHTLGASGITLSGKHIELAPHTAEVFSVYIGRWAGNGSDLFVVDTDASLLIKGSVIIGGGGTAVRVKSAAPNLGVFTLDGGARIALDSQVFLESSGPLPADKAKITVGGGFSGSIDAIARIGIDQSEYASTRQVLDGTAADIAACRFRFRVSPEYPAGWASPRYWGVDTTGSLEHYVAAHSGGQNGIYGIGEGLVTYTKLKDAFDIAGGSLGAPKDLYFVSNIDLDASASYTVQTGNYIRLIVPPGHHYMLKRTASTTSNMLVIDPSASLELSAPYGSITIDGGAVWNGSGNPAAGASNTGVTSDQALVYVQGSGIQGYFTLSQGAVLQNNDNTSSNNGGAVHAQGVFIMRGGQITRNRAAGSGGGIYYVGNTYVSRTISGGSITNNDAALSGGGIMMDLDGKVTLTMSGGMISGNRASGTDGGLVTSGFGCGGGVFIPGPATANTFNMSGGTISGNISANGNGNGIAVDRLGYGGSANFYMSGSAYIAPNNDVYLYGAPSSNDCVITIIGNLAYSPAATIDSHLVTSTQVQVISTSSFGYPAVAGRFAAAAGRTLHPNGTLTNP
ncbi:MAG: hypothetical protein LBJ31_10720 [Treponema sp.]|jgi:hypothetical protein|nr:hypothetical protein [Treponema sp.]